MNIKNLRKSDNAVVGIIVAILLIGLMISVISIIQTVFIPNWMKEIEADHMDTVAGQFGQLKFAVDLQRAIDRTNLPISTPITLGNKGFPILQSSKSYGTIDIIENEFYLNIVVNETETLPPIPLGEIRYSSDNFYYLDQDFIYESGAIIVSQREGNIITIKPEFILERSDIGTYYLNISLIDITSIANKKSASGYGVYPIRLEYNNIRDLSEEINISDVTDITFSTNYPESWTLFFKNLLKNQEIPDDDIEIILTDYSPGLYLNELSSYFEPDSSILNITITAIDAQVAPGWIDE
jgi:hypothetical protein